MENSRQMTALAALEAVAGGSTGNAAEHGRLDFKTDGRSLDDDLVNLADACACFANADGGTVLVGVDDKKSGADAFVGTRLDPDRTRKRIHELTSPPLVVECTVIDHEDGQILALYVARGLSVHTVKSKLPTERIGDSCMPMSTDRIASVVAERQGKDWSAAPTEISVKDVDGLAIAAAREMLERSPREAIRRLARDSEVNLLRGLGVVTAKDSLTQAGALLFTTKLDRGVEIAYVHRRTPAGAVTANEQLEAPLVLALQRTFDLIDARSDRTPVTIGKGQQIHIADLPEAAIREAIVNAAMHREYRQQGRVTIEHTQTQLTVDSPGGFVSGVRADNLLTTSSRTRNSQLAQALRALNLAETAGSGVDKMYAEMVRVGHQPPAFSSGGDSVRVALSGGAPNSAITRFVATLPSEEADDADTMLVLLHLLNNRLISAAEATPILQKVRIEEAQAVLQRLASEPIALLEPTRETARRSHPRYRLREAPLAALGSAVTYRRRTTDQLDRKVIEMVRETGTINSRIIKVMLDLDTRSASRLLSDMVGRGILTKLEGPKRGPGVLYGPGLSFPQKGRKKSNTLTGEDPNTLPMTFD